jgi:acetate kinase
MARERRILAINSGSSSLKFALYQVGGVERRLLGGELSRIGQEDGVFIAVDASGVGLVDEHLALMDHDAAVGRLLAWLGEDAGGRMPEAIGHRLVHGGAHYTRPLRLSPEAQMELWELVPLAPQHLPQELRAIEAVGQAYPDLPQVACFDTAFHHTLPPVAQRIALTRELESEGVRRYGFHGLSYEYIVRELATEGSGAVPACLIVAHLGNGASMAAIRDGQSVETTMGFTPAGGLVMSTRSGDLDPGVLIYLLRERGLSVDALDALINQQAGLLGTSQLSGDMQNLLASADARARDAVELFCYSARKTIGALTTVLGGLDMLVFTGGIGEHAAAVRTQICAGLEYLGIQLDPTRNDSNSDPLSPMGSTVTVRRIPTNEELMIARHTAAILDETG